MVIVLTSTNYSNFILEAKYKSEPSTSQYHISLENVGLRGEHNVFSRRARLVQDQK